MQFAIQDITTKLYYVKKNCWSRLLKDAKPYKSERSADKACDRLNKLYKTCKYDTVDGWQNVG